MTIDQVDQPIGTQEPTAAAGLAAIPTRSRRVTPFTVLIRSLFALALLVPVAIIATAPAAAATTIASTTTCGNSLGAVLGGRGVICGVTVINTITASGGSATVTVRECFGSAGQPTDGTGPGGFACTNKTVALAAPVSAVTQCNSSINGGGGKLLCSVMITNNFVGVSPGETTATVNQCVGSGASGGLKIKCNPVAAAASAAITQCNGSANGGTLVGLICTVTGKMASAFPITINQANGSANGGGALIVSSVILINNAAPAATATPATPTLAPGATATPTLAPGATATPTLAPGATATATLAPGATATPTLAPGATATATLAPGATPTPTAGSTATPTAGTTSSLPPTNTVSDSSSNNSTQSPFVLLISLAMGLGLAAFVARRRSIRS